MASKRAKRKLGAFLPRLRDLWQIYNRWELALFGMGALSFIGIFVILFMPIGKGPELTRPDGPLPSVDSHAFMVTISRFMALPIDQAPRPEVLVNGDQFVARLLPDIDSARHSISLMAYIWKDGKFSDMLLDHLERKQKAGVQVRILLDAYGGLMAPIRKLKRLKSLGGKVATFHSLTPLPWTIMRSTKRNHRRAIVIDGDIAYTGGVGVDDVWLGQARTPSEWHDLMFRVRGSMVGRLQGSFAELWAAATGELLVEPGSGDTPGGELLPYVALSSSPSPDLYETETFFLMSLLAAQHAILIETPYFLPNASIRKILIDKAKSGVGVTVLVPNEHTDEKSVRWAGQRIYEKLLEGGVKIYEYQPTFTHTKLLLEDGTWSVIGSANQDIRSRRLNDEVVFGISDTSLASSLRAIYAQDLARSKQITLSGWRHRGLMQRTLEFVSQMFVQQY